MIKGIVFILSVLIIGFLLIVHNAMSRPLYNKIHNVWEEDPEGKKYANITLVVMLLIAFFTGMMF
jgi:Na+(H+)/acetate symporter ActP